jgi:hypothetical protein
MLFLFSSIKGLPETAFQNVNQKKTWILNAADITYSFNWNNLFKRYKSNKLT